MLDDTDKTINRPVRLYRNRPLAFSFARFILAGLIHPVHSAGGTTYQGARLVIITHGSADVLEPLLGEHFTAGPDWHLHTTLVLADGEPVIDLIQVRSPLARNLRRRERAGTSTRRR